MSFHVVMERIGRHNNVFGVERSNMVVQTGLSFEYSVFMIVITIRIYEELLIPHVCYVFNTLPEATCVMQTI